MKNLNAENIEHMMFSSKSSSERFEDEIRNKVEQMRTLRLKKIVPVDMEGQVVSDEDYEKILQLADFIALYIREAGKEQTIRDFQTGLNLLNKYKKHSLVESKIQLEEDGWCGEKTCAAMFDVLKNYPLEIVKHYVRLGALNNAIWETKNLSHVDTDKHVAQTAEKFEERGL